MDICATCNRPVADHGAAMVCPTPWLVGFDPAANPLAREVTFMEYLRNYLHSVADIATRDEMAKLRQRLAEAEVALAEAQAAAIILAHAYEHDSRPPDDVLESVAQWREANKRKHAQTKARKL